MKKFSIIIFLYFINSGISFSNIIDTKNIIENFDICKTSSSLGQRCKENNFNYKKFFNSGKKTIKNNTINYEIDEWNYYFEIIESTQTKTIIKFTDKAKYASYNNISLITLEFSKKDNKWNIVSNETIFPKSEIEKLDLPNDRVGKLFPEHYKKVQQFRKLNINKFEFDCVIDEEFTGSKSKTRWFSKFREKIFLDFNLKTITLEGMGVGLTRKGAISSNKIVSKNLPFYFEQEKNKQTIFTTVATIPNINEIHTFKIFYYNNDDWNNFFQYQIYQLSRETFNNFVKFHYNTGTLNEFENWREDINFKIKKTQGVSLFPVHKSRSGFGDCLATIK